MFFYSERINECVYSQYFRRDEEGMQEGSSDDMVEQALKALPASSSAATVGKVNYDDVD